ncbi:MAG: cytochrome c oxidase subunit 3 [Gammaproteobacteria bacterium]
MNLFRKLATKPWLEQDTGSDPRPADILPVETAKVGLFIFLAVITFLFFLFIVAYHMREDYDDWVALSEPRLLWVNTLLLIFSSVAMQRARSAFHDDEVSAAKVNLTAGGVFTVAFLAGQLVVWRQLISDGYFAASNPANAAFYLLTFVHGAHMLGGLWVLGKTNFRLWSGQRVEKAILSVELCTTYWHYLLLVWLVIFGLLLST